MTQKQFDDLDKLISATTDNTAKIGKRVDNHAVILESINSGITAILKNQKILLDEISKLKKSN
ncbi:hypothetical protein [Winogradskyella sp. SYSU M77433]|uniref:hypothetical protein n=1 Tax=Winogradskyella sp. SYSU M77433 TaxID=3042722 RepID=UPI0024800337|nr:hypothetical protein [Winogradskyella sp. SYSU M77433]MDH7912315.1 hypothetical protein [Winogradskyella sp. SYSU M77433]